MVVECGLSGAYLSYFKGIYPSTNENKSYACEIKVGYSLVVSTTYKFTYIVCCHWLMGKNTPKL
jgi:hypothetical protein